MVVDVARWRAFTIEEITPVYESMNSSYEKRGVLSDVEKSQAFSAPEVVYELKRLKVLFFNRSFQPSMIQHILDLYERVSARDTANKNLHIKLEETNESVRLL